jgi:catechol 2,3-dioxygenase-like lactoylglutathione lyase family enzyme
MPKMHVSLNVANIPDSIEFYRQFFGAEPVMVKHDYARFELSNPPLNFAMNARLPDEAGDNGRLSHLGFQVEGAEGVESARKRLAASAILSLDETDTVCCYTRQDKVWATDPDGNRWEVFFVTDADVDAPTFQGEACCVPVGETADGSCCTPADRQDAVATGKGCC